MQKHLQLVTMRILTINYSEIFYYSDTLIGKLKYKILILNVL